MTRAFAILAEPASYTEDRNHAVYDKLGIGYCYMHGESLAVADASESLDVLPGKWLPLMQRLRQILRENEVVIMNGYSNIVFVLLFLLNFFYRRRIGIDSDTQLVIPVGRCKRILKDLFLRFIFGNRYVYGLAGGTRTHKDLFRYYGMPEKRIFLMPMMVNNERFGHQSEQRKGKFRFLYVGRIIDIKNIQLLLDSFVRTYGNNSEVELYVVGKGDLLDTYRLRYGKYANIVFTGPKYGQELVQAYAEAHVLVLPSSVEPWGLVVNEAMAAGLPCIVSDCVGAAWDLVDGKETGFIFRHDDAEALSRCMLRLFEDSALYARYAANAYRLMLDEWNYAFYQKCLMEFLEA